MASRPCVAQYAKNLQRETEGKIMSTAITKAKEHLVVYCPGILPNGNICDANLRHTLLINLSQKAGSTKSKQGIAMRKLTNLACYCSIDFFDPLSVYTCMMHFIW